LEVEKNMDFLSLIAQHPYRLVDWFVMGDLILFQVVKKMFQDVEGVRGISRVLYDLTAKPPGTTEWE